MWMQFASQIYEEGDFFLKRIRSTLVIFVGQLIPLFWTYSDLQFQSQDWYPRVDDLSPACDELFRFTSVCDIRESSWGFSLTYFIKQQFFATFSRFRCQCLLDVFVLVIDQWNTLFLSLAPMSEEFNHNNSTTTTSNNNNNIHRPTIWSEKCKNLWSPFWNFIFIQYSPS